MTEGNLSTINREGTMKKKREIFQEGNYWKFRQFSERFFGKSLIRMQKPSRQSCRFRFDQQNFSKFYLDKVGFGRISAVPVQGLRKPLILREDAVNALPTHGRCKFSQHGLKFIPSSRPADVYHLPVLSRQKNSAKKIKVFLWLGLNKTDSPLSPCAPLRAGTCRWTRPGNRLASPAPAPNTCSALPKASWTKEKFRQTKKQFPIQSWRKKRWQI